MQLRYRIQLSTDVNFVHIVGTVSNIATNVITRQELQNLGVTLTNGQTYYWRVQEYDVDNMFLASDWTEARNFTGVILIQPTIRITTTPTAHTIMRGQVRTFTVSIDNLSTDSQTVNLSITSQNLHISPRLMPST